jgi:hypothetical protein
MPVRKPQSYPVSIEDLLLEWTIFKPSLKELFTPEEVKGMIEGGFELEYECPYCKGSASIQPATVIYGSSGKTYPDVLVCDGSTGGGRCDAYVGTHTAGPRIGKPLGTIADRELRELRKICHNRYFDPLWKEGEKERKEAYDYLSMIMAKPKLLAHIAMFNTADCGHFIHLMKTRESWDLDYAAKLLKKTPKKGWDALLGSKFGRV